MIGKNIWTIGDGFMSDTASGDYVSHEAVCVLNISGSDADIELTIYFEDRDPLGGFHAVCKNNRTNHIRLDKIKNENGESIPKNVPYAIMVRSSAPVVVQHSRMDVTQPDMTLMSTIAY